MRIYKIDEELMKIQKCDETKHFAKILVPKRIFTNMLIVFCDKHFLNKSPQQFSPRSLIHFSSL